jgi:hypothetical protein
MQRGKTRTLALWVVTPQSPTTDKKRITTATVIGGLAVPLMAVYGYSSWFFPNTIVEVGAVLPAVAAALWVALALARRPVAKTHTAGIPRISKPFLVTGVAVFGAITAWVALAIGFPAIVTAALSPNGQAIAVIESKTTGRWVRRSCDYKLALVGYAATFKHDFCVDSDVWTRVNVGDKVNLQVRRDAFGTRIYDIRRPES